MTSASLNDGKAAIPLLKGIQERLPSLPIRYGLMDAGYDSGGMVHPNTHRPILGQKQDLKQNRT